jgi:uncharacterized protein YijF (DUF1287 family)
MIKLISVILGKLLFIAALVCSQNALSHNFEKDIVAAAIDQTQQKVRYDGSYFSIAYPNGDVPANVGVCSDVVIRAYRKLGVDLQVLVHEDMAKNFALYPSKKLWGLHSTDRNIDHRRVPNLQVFFSRHGKVLAVTDKAQDYAAGDIVTWMLPGNLPHIGIVTDKTARGSESPLIVHNIGAGPKLEDMIFAYKITGHYRYHPNTSAKKR